MTTSPDRREYYRQRYLRNRERILEKQKSYGKQPEVRARRLKYWHERYKARIASDPTLKAKRRRQQLDSYYLRHYGTTTPEPGARSVIDGRRYLGPKELRPPKPCPPSTATKSASSSIPTSKRTEVPTTGTGRNSSTRVHTKQSTSPTPSSSPAARPTTPTTTKATPAPSTKPPWIPTPVSRWEPGLARQAEREFYL